MDDLETNKLIKYGFSSGNGFLLTEEERNELEFRIDRLFDNESIAKDVSANAPSLVNLLGNDKRIDFLIEKLLTNERVKSILIHMLGEGYKVWEISARYSEPGDPGLALHQDGWGQLNFVYSLNNTGNKDGVTMLLPGTHFLPRIINYISWRIPKWGGIFSKPLIFKGTDYGFFINKTWHGRFSNRSNQTKKIVLIACYPNKGKYRKIYSDLYFENICNDFREIKMRLDWRSGTKINDDGMIFVDAPGDDVRFTAQIEDKTIINLRTFILFFEVFLLESFFRPLRILLKIFKLIRNLFF